jgi:hypothetical protein
MCKVFLNLPQCRLVFVSFGPTSGIHRALVASYRLSRMLAQFGRVPDSYGRELNSGPDKQILSYCVILRFIEMFSLLWR